MYLKLTVVYYLLLTIIEGKGTISLVSQERRKSYSIEFGDIIGVPAGTTVYLINQQNDENLKIAKLLQPVNNPGQFKVTEQIHESYSLLE